MEYYAKERKIVIVPLELIGGLVLIDLSWILSSDTYNPSYPFVAYGYLIIIAIIIHSILVIWPMIKIYRRFTKERLKSIYNEIKKALTDEQKVELKKWIRSEVLFMLFPGGIALALRLWAGEPNEFEWTNLTLIVGFALATIWITLQIWQAIEMNRTLKPMLSTWRNPKLISNSIGLFNITKDRLEILAKLQPEYIERSEDEVAPMQNMVVESEQGSLKLDGDAIVQNLKEVGVKAATAIHNVGQLGKSVVGKVSSKTVEKVDEKIQKKVDEITKPKLFSKDKVIVFALALLPLLAIYVILPYLS